MISQRSCSKCACVLITNHISARRRRHQDQKIYAVVITDDKCGDSPQFEESGRAGFANAEKSPNVGSPQMPESQLTVRTIPRISAATAASTESTR